jgi:hypothetical protein
MLRYSGGMQTVNDLLLIVLILAVFAAYWLPTIIASWRRIPARTQILVINLFLGWTLVGWVVALVMAIRPADPARPAPPLPPPGQDPGPTRSVSA